MRIFRKTVFSFCYSMATSWSHKFNVLISVDVNDDDEYRYAPLIMRLCLGILGVRKHAQKNRVSRSRNGLFMPDRAKKDQNRLLHNLTNSRNFNFCFSYFIYFLVVQC